MMLEIRDMTPMDRDVVMPMVTEFYRSPAVEHNVDAAILERTFRDAADPGMPVIRGLLLLEDGAAVGYCYVTGYYAAEVGGRCLMIEELFFQPECRGKGFGSQVFAWLRAEYADYARLRLEVTAANRDAVRLYERWGFRFLEYDQMVLDQAPGERAE